MFLIKMLGFIVVLAVIQFFFVKRKNRILGLILPVLNVTVSTIYCLPDILAAFHKEFSFPMLIIAILPWLAYNVSTIIFIVIYRYEKEIS